MLGGAMLVLIALIVACVQVAAVMRSRERVQFFPPAVAATAVALLAGLYLILGAEFRWVSGQLLDDLTPWILIAAIAWMFFNRMSAKRNRLPRA